MTDTQERERPADARSLEDAAKMCREVAEEASTEAVEWIQAGDEPAANRLWKRADLLREAAQALTERPEPSDPLAEIVIDEFALNEAAIALMEMRGGPGTPRREEAHAAIYAYLRAVERPEVEREPDGYAHPEDVKRFNDKRTGNLAVYRSRWSDEAVAVYFGQPAPSPEAGEPEPIERTGAQGGRDLLDVFDDIGEQCEQLGRLGDRPGYASEIFKLVGEGIALICGADAGAAPAEDARAEALEGLRDLLTWFPERPERGFCGAIRDENSELYRSNYVPADIIEELRALTEAPPAEPQGDGEKRYARWWAELAPARDGMPYNALTLLHSIFAELGEQSRTIARLTRDVPEGEPGRRQRLIVNAVHAIIGYTSLWDEGLNPEHGDYAARIRERANEILKLTAGEPIPEDFKSYIMRHTPRTHGAAPECSDPACTFENPTCRASRSPRDGDSEEVQGSVGTAGHIPTAPSNTNNNG